MNIFEQREIGKIIWEKAYDDFDKRIDLNEVVLKANLPKEEVKAYLVHNEFIEGSRIPTGEYYFYISWGGINEFAPTNYINRSLERIRENINKINQSIDLMEVLGLSKNQFKLAQFLAHRLESLGDIKRERNNDRSYYYVKSIGY